MNQPVRNWASRFALSIFVAATLLPVLAQDGEGERVRGYLPPPTDLHLVDDHWTPYDPPVPPEGSQVHIIVPGDTLWDLAVHYYEDPYLWPIIWDANRYITYSHWIYPGDPLMVPPRPTVVGQEGIAPEPVPVEPPPERPMRDDAFEKAEAVAPPPVPMGPVLIPAAEQQELLCASQLVERFDPTRLSVLGAEEPERNLHSTGDIIYLSAGRDMAIEPGAEYVVVRSEGLIDHPNNPKAAVAVYLRRLGRLRVLAVHPTSASAEIIDSCDGIRVGDFLMPYREMPVPMVERIPLRELATPFPGRLNGVVVVSHAKHATIAASGEIVGIDLGARAGLTAGDRILFWREGPGGIGLSGKNQAPRRVVAQGVVLVTNAGGSMVKILESATEVRLGDSAEVL